MYYDGQLHIRYQNTYSFKFKVPLLQTGLMDGYLSSTGIKL